MKRIRLVIGGLMIVCGLCSAQTPHSNDLKEAPKPILTGGHSKAHQAMKDVFAKQRAELAAVEKDSTLSPEKKEAAKSAIRLRHAAERNQIRLRAWADRKALQQKNLRRRASGQQKQQLKNPGNSKQ